jgi:hypothetical protein
MRTLPTKRPGRPRLLAMLFALALALAVAPASAAGASPPAAGTVVEGVAAPGLALGTTRAGVEAAYGPESFCQGPLQNFCTYNVGIGSVSVWYRGADGADATASAGDVLFNLSWSGFPGWATTAGITTAGALAEPDAAIAAYPGATLVYNQFGIYSLRDEARGLSITWVRNVYSGTVTVTMAIFAGTGSPPPPPPPPPPPSVGLVSVSSITMSVTGKTVVAVVRVVDDGGAPVPGAAIDATWIPPRGASGSLQATTDAQGRATFTVRKARGTHTIRIGSVTKAGFEYDEQASVTEQSLYVRR